MKMLKNVEQKNERNQINLIRNIKYMLTGS